MIKGSGKCYRFESFDSNSEFQFSSFGWFCLCKIEDETLLSKLQ